MKDLIKNKVVKFNGGDILVKSARDKHGNGLVSFERQTTHEIGECVKNTDKTIEEFIQSSDLVFSFKNYNSIDVVIEYLEWAKQSMMDLVEHQPNNPNCECNECRLEKTLAEEEEKYRLVEFGKALEWSQHQCNYDWFCFEQDGVECHKWFNEELLLKLYRESQQEE